MKQSLTDYNFPEDLKAMSPEELELLSYGIREFLLETVSKTGGHLASNLGVVELSIALHKVFDTPKDKIIWDVGHQSYVHKILSGRAGEMNTLRQTGGISGFPKSCESEYDAYDTGHSSTSLSAAAGMAAARDLKGEDHEIIAVIGDGSLTGGMAYEALNNIGASRTRMIVVINDNGMSISKNIGGMSDHLSRLRSSIQYQEAKRNLKEQIRKIPKVGKNISDSLSGAKDKVKYALISDGILFEELRFTYLGPFDGHNLSDVIEALNSAKHVDGPVVIHLITKKGKGYRNAENDPNRFHGTGPFDIETGVPVSPSCRGYSDVLGDEILRLAAADPGITAITAAMGTATGLNRFSQEYPDRFFDVGIAEAHAVTFAAGLAKSGMHPLVAIYSSFLQRAYDQIIEDVCLQDLPVVFAIDRAGIVGADGPTHHGLMDLAYLLPIPNISVFTPSCEEQMRAMLRYAFTLNDPVAIRYPRGACASVSSVSEDFDGTNLRLAEGKDADIWAVGSMLETAEKVRMILEQKGIHAGIVDVRCAKPMDLSLLDPEIPYVVSLEDGMITGGYGMNMKSRIPDGIHMDIIGWPDRFIEHGSPADLYRKYGLDPESIAERMIRHLERKT